MRLWSRRRRPTASPAIPKEVALPSPRRIAVPAAALLAAAALALAGAPGIRTAGAVMIRADSVSADSLRPAGPAAMTAGGTAESAPAPPRDYLAEARASYTPVNRAYQNTRVVTAFAGPILGALVLLVLLFTGISARFRDIAHALGHRLYVRVLVYFALLLTATTLLGLPFAWYSEFALEHQYGLSTQTLPGWLLDTLKALVFNLVALGVIPILYAAWRVVRRHPRGWWWRLAAGTAPIALAAVILQPLVFDPLFNRFEPLRDAGLRGDILALGARAGIPAKHVFQVDMSRRTKKLNAYVSGFGGSQRIVLWDTTLESMQRDEILVVMGHEMGHYVLRHIWKSILVIAIGAFAVFWLAERLTAWMLAAWGRRWEAEGPGDLAALPALWLSLSLVMALATPGLNALSRGVELESDVYALEITHDNDAAARAFLKLAQDNRSNPEPSEWVKLLLYSHPPLADRIRFALSYRPWEKGEPNRFFHGR
ncbi:MAG: M48 family metallopeptidase [Candidatus Eisenbacteria bacterium]|nr:M48 family metallopeptidase [Candidatus Eisenbacteria bacterium]